MRTRRIAALATLFVLVCVATVLAAITVVQVSASGGGTAALTSNQTAGNTNFVVSGYCMDGSCFNDACNPIVATDTPNGSYTSDASEAMATVCIGIARFFNIAHTTSSNTINCTVSGPSYQVCISAEINGLGVSPTVSAAGTSNSSTVSTTGSAANGDVCFAFIYSSAQPSAPAGWTDIQNYANMDFIYQVQGSSGTVTITSWPNASGITGSGIQCYTPTAATVHNGVARVY